jgi:hypothetical protein
MEHANNPDVIAAGCVCAEHLEQDYIRPRQREGRLKSAARRRKSHMIEYTNPQVLRSIRFPNSLERKRMWGWIHTHHDDLQALGPLATILAAIIAVLVTGILGLAQWRIARAQKDIAYDKLKLDLFDKRYAIYQAALSLSRQFMPSNKQIPSDRLDELHDMLLEASFFFSADVVALTRRIYNLSFEWQQQAEALSSVDDPLSGKLREEFVRRQVLIPKEMGRLKIIVDGVFLQDLSFKQLTEK